MKSPVLLLVSCLALSGCSDDEPSPGVLVVDWSIDGFQDPNLCRLTGSDVINIAIETSSGYFVGEFEAVCEAFATGITLPPDGYFGDAVLLDPAGGVRTTAADFGFFEIFGNDELVIPIDFPADSFY